MAQNGEIDLSRLKAYYSVEDIRLVDLDKVTRANEDRLYFEIAFSIGLVFLGNLLNGYSRPILFSCVAFVGASAFFLVRYGIKSRRLRAASGSVGESAPG